MSIDQYRFLKGIILEQESDTTKLVQIQPGSGSTTGTTFTLTTAQTANRTQTFQDVDGTVLARNSANSTVNVNSARITNLSEPTTSTDAVTKNYADGIALGTEFTDSNFRVHNNSDVSKTLALDLSSISTGTTRTWILPNASSTFVGIDVTQTLTNKTLTSPIINTPTGITKSDVGLGNVDNTSDATKNTAVATLTNKTLTGNTAVNLISGSGTLVLNTSGTITLPNATDTLVGKATTDSLTNKTFSDAITTAQILTPSNPASGFNKVYSKSDNQFYSLDSSGNERIFGVPTGTILDFGSAVAPTGYLICNGSVVSQTTYAELYAVITSTYNTGGEGAGNFRLPDSRGRSSLGAGTGSGLSARNVGTNGGEETHALTEAEGPSHYHGILDAAGGVTEPSNAASRGFAALNTNNSGYITTSGGGVRFIETAGGNSVHGGPPGDGNAHNNMHPFIVFNKIIKY